MVGPPVAAAVEAVDRSGRLWLLDPEEEPWLLREFANRLLFKFLLLMFNDVSRVVGKFLTGVESVIWAEMEDEAEDIISLLLESRQSFQLNTFGWE